MSSLVLYKELYSDVHMSVPGVGSSLCNYEVVTAIGQEHAPTLPFRHFNFSDDTLNREVMQPETLEMPREMTARVLAFCEATYVDGHYGFNCFSFVDFAMGWDQEIRTGIPRNFRVESANPQEAESNEPYLVRSPGAYGGDTGGHVFFGAPRAGYAFNVVGPNMPLAINKNTELLRTFGSETLQHILSYERL